MQYTAIHCKSQSNLVQSSARQCTTVHHAASQCNTAAHYNPLQQAYCHRMLPSHQSQLTCAISAPHCNKLQYTATHCKTHTAIAIELQHTATHCNPLQHTATHCITHTAIAMELLIKVKPSLERLQVLENIRQDKMQKRPLVIMLKYEFSAQFTVDVPRHCLYC